MGSVRHTPESRDDLIDIWVFVAERSRSAADRLMDSVREKCQLLAESPELGRGREELAPSLRSFPVEKYTIFYRPTQDGIEVIRVLSSYRDIDSLLF